jgi:hypothetical protein
VVFTPVLAVVPLVFAVVSPVLAAVLASVNPVGDDDRAAHRCGGSPPPPGC